MKHYNPRFTRRNVRAFAASLLSYLMLAGQLAPLALASNSYAPRASRPASSDIARENAGEVQPTLASAASSILAPAALVPNITATKVDTYPSSPNPAQPGETITYDVTITNSGTTDATNVTLTDTVDSNTTLVGASVVSSPIAVNDTYNVIGNVRIQPNAAQGLLANDNNPNTGNNTGLTASGPSASASNGQVVVNGDGSFTYNPPPGFTGTDSFTYTITRAGATGDTTDTATVTLEVGLATHDKLIWFINNTNVAAGRDGRLTNPFNSIGEFNSTAADDPGDIIFIYQGSGSYTGNLTLLNAQQLIGQGVDLATATGITVPPYSDPLPGATANPVINSTAGNTITLGQNNAIRGLTLNDSVGIDIIGNAFGTLTTSALTISGTGRPLSLTNGTLAATFNQITSTSSAGGQGILLSSVGGTMTVTGGTSITGATTQGILVTGSTVAANFGNTTVSGGTDGVSLQNNTGGPRTFGTLSISGNTVDGFVHGAGGGATNVTGATTITNPGGIGINIQNSNAAISFAATTVGKNNAGTGVNLATNGANTTSFTSLAVTTANGVGLAASSGGSVTIGGGSISSTSTGTGDGAAINALSTTFNATFATLSSTNSGGTNRGVFLTSVGGSISVTTSTTVTNPGGVGINVATSSANLSFGATTVNQSGGTGVFLNTNTGTASFTSLNIAPDTSQRAFHATSNTGAITSTSGAVSTTNQIAVEVTGVSAGSRTPLNMQLTSVSALASGGNPSSGIVLTNTSSSGSPGGFRVLGSGGNCTIADQTCTGGHIQSATNDGVALNAATNVFLTRMKITSPGQHGVSGTGNVSTFSFDNGIITNAGNGNDEDALFFGTPATTNITGTLTLSNSALQGFSERGLHVKNTTGALTIDVSNSSFLDNQDTFGANAILVEGFGTSGIVLNVTNSTFDNVELNSVQYEAEGSGTNDVNIIGNAFTAGGGPDNNPFGGGIELIVDLGATMNFDIQGNFFNDIPDDAILIVGEGNTQGRIGGDLPAPAGAPGPGNHSNKGNRIQHGAGFNGFAGDGIRLDDDGTFNAGVQPTTTWTILIKNNVLDLDPGGAGTGGGAVGDQGIVVFNRDHPGTLNVTVQNNTITDTLNEGYRAFTADRDGAVTAGPTTNMRVASNTFNNIGGAAAISATSDDQSSVCADITGNNGNGPGSSPEGNIFIDRRVATAQFFVPQSSTAAISAANNGAPVSPPSPVAPTFNTPCNVPLPTNAAPDDFSIVGDDEATADSVEPAQASPASSSMGGGVTSSPFISMPQQAQAQPQTAPAAAAQSGPATNRGRLGGGGDEHVAQPPVVMGNTLTFNIGTLPAGKSVTITFQVTINNPFPAGVTQVSNQGTVSGGNFANVLTDDPSVAGTANATVTPVQPPPDIFIRNASGPEPAAPNTNQMAFTVVLSNPSSQTVTVNYSTANGTATGGANCGDPNVDYESIPSTVLTFAPGQTVQTVSVEICSDALADDGETFTVNLSGPTNGNLGNTSATGTITANTPGTLIISELRTSGPGSTGTGDANDEFIELYNNTGSNITVPAGGWAVVKSGATCGATPVIVAVIPSSTVIPARGHYLLVGTGYSLTGYAAGDQPLTSPIEDDRNVGVFSTPNLIDLSSVTRLDAVGFGTNTGNNCDLLREGTNLPAASGSILQYSFVRSISMLTGQPQDANDNTADFIVVSTTGAAVGSNPTPQLGAPGPENTTSPIVRGHSLSGISSQFLDPSASSAGPPNREKSFTGVTNGPQGTLTIRRTFTNNTGANVTRLRVRIINLTTLNSPNQFGGAGQADLRALDSSDNPAVPTSGGPVFVRGTTIETPPTQPNGGGMNSSYRLTTPGVITMAQPLLPGSSVNVQFVLGIVTNGKFNFFVNIEALP